MEPARLSWLLNVLLIQIGSIRILVFVDEFVDEKCLINIYELLFLLLLWLLRSCPFPVKLLGSFPGVVGAFLNRMAMSLITDAFSRLDGKPGKHSNGSVEIVELSHRKKAIFMNRKTYVPFETRADLHSSFLVEL